MAMYYGQLTNMDKGGKATRTGHRSLSAKGNGWNVGGFVNVFRCGHCDKDMVEVGFTGGSNGAEHPGDTLTFHEPDGGKCEREQVNDLLHGQDGCPFQHGPKAVAS